MDINGVFYKGYISIHSDNTYSSESNTVPTPPQNYGDPSPQIREKLGLDDDGQNNLPCPQHELLFSETLHLNSPTPHIVCLCLIPPTSLPHIPLCSDTQIPSVPGHLATELSKGETGPSISLCLHIDKMRGVLSPLIQTQRTRLHPSPGLTRGQTIHQLQSTPGQESHRHPQKPRRLRLQQVPALCPSPILLLPTATHVQGHQKMAYPSARRLPKRFL